MIGIFIFLFGSWGWLEAQTELFKPMPFQELLIDYGGETVIRTEVGVRVTLLQGVDMDSTVYVETHQKNTNNNGMVSFVIGDGLPFKGAVFKAIDFADGPYFIKREYDLNGGSDYTIENISQMVSVPFAMHANLADTTLWAPYPWQDSLPSLVGIQITLLQGELNENTIFVETHQKNINTYGLIFLDIGSGTLVSGSKSFDPSNGPYAIKVEYDLNGGSNYTNNYIEDLYPDYSDNYSLPNPFTLRIGSSYKKVVLITNADSTYSWVEPVIPLEGAQGQFLSVDSSGTLSWKDGLPAFPEDTKVLGYSNSSFGWVDKVDLPTTIGSENKPYYALGSDGDGLSLIGVDTIAGATGTKGQILVYDADNMQQKWIDHIAKLPDVFNEGDVLTIGDTGEETWIGNTGIRKLSLGPDTTLGGVVFRLSDDSTHALVAAFRDLNVDTILGSTSLMIDTVSWYEARDIVNDSTGYDEFGKDFFDWRLPTREEFLELNQNQDITLSSSVGYWTSTQDDDYQVNPMELRAKSWYSNRPPDADTDGIVSELKSKGLLVRPVRLVRYR